ncbi:MAG: hypothetical protein K1060chlam2_00874 [Chlamydiae bacterium]|nr:hypothetical protein [Chlamydiota bacterium]
MRYLKLFLLLCCLPLLADVESSPVKKVEEQKIEDMRDETPPVDVNKATESYETAFIKTIVVLVAFLLLILLTIWMFKKISRGRMRTFNYHKTVKILEKRPLSPKSMLYLIEVGGKQVLIAESQFEVRTVVTLDDLTIGKDL